MPNNPLAHLRAIHPFGTRERMEDYWKSIMNVSDKSRYNLSKNFGYLSGKHFEAHIAAVNEGVKYYWLVYESNFNVKDWENYISALKKEVDSAKVDEQIHCHILPINEQTRRIDWRITVFEKQITLCARERRRGDYEKSKVTVEFDEKSTSKLVETLKNLFDRCPDVKYAKPSKVMEKDDEGRIF